MIRFLCAFIFLFNLSVFSQKNTNTIVLENTSLFEVIQIVEKQYDVKFSYIDSLLDHHKISITIDPETSIKQLVKELELKTSLKFNFTGNNFISIRSFNKSDKIFVCGYILDKNKKPLKDIRIFFKSTRSNTTTDKNGYFEYSEVPYNSIILISAPDFRQKVLNSKSFLFNNCAKMYLIPAEEELLDEVLIEEYLAKGISQNKKIIDVNLKDVEVLPGRTEPDILQSVQLTPGVNNPYETASGLFVRGSTPHQNLVLWNGIKTYQQAHFFGMLSSFNPYVAKNVNFYKSGVSARYGDRIAGVVNITSENEIADRFTGGAGINMINADAVVHTPIIKDKVSLQVSGRRSYTDVFETFTYNQLSDRVFQNTKIVDSVNFNNEKKEFFYADYNANLLIQPSEYQKIEINTIYGTNDLDFRQNDDNESFNDNLVTKNEGYNIRWNSIFSDKVSLHMHSYYTKYILNYQFITRDNDVKTSTEHKKNYVRDYGGELHLKYQMSLYQKLSLGYQYSNNNTRYAFVTTTPSYELILDENDSYLNTHSFYSEYQFEDPKNFYISVGLRMNHYQELSQSFVEPRIFLQKHISTYWEINTSVEYRSQATSQIQESVISDLSLENQVWTLANNDQFPIISSYQYTFGSSFKKNKWYFDIGGYFKQIDDVTSLTAGFINPINNTYQNGESKIYGFDVFLKKRFLNYKTWISYSYINTRNKFKNINNNEFFPGNWNIEHTVKWSHFYRIKNFQFSLGWFWHTGKAFTNVTQVDNGNEIVLLEYDAINSANLPIYHRLDFSAIYDFTIGSTSSIKYRLGISVLNLYDRKNILNREFRTTNSLNNQFIDANIISLGITPNLSFRIFW
ncbi:TonB-dependent receptor plug domain-containing protein [Aquimarina sp. U1-2]|uniref:TonB-dependent receptor plug domain-containing protein n=1 Tax=Aquimarina sp. U1-2 TaxID=2823141 RepID=UPI001AEC93D8|nr:TonB-dependent receptor plug domain-containing protein [Aquimarina sp. U1-2]MBP2832339.1 TonB-dependent receptor plug domain-containing protein [Aquimarina sp. U1-2]